MTLSGSWWVVGRAHSQAFTCSWRWLSRSRSVHISKLSLKKKKTCTHVSNSLVRTAKKVAMSQANHSSPPTAVADGTDFRGTCTHILTPWSVLKNCFFRLSLWEPGTGSQAVETRSSRSRFPHDEMDAVPNSRQRTVMASGALSDTEGGMTFD